MTNNIQSQIAEFAGKFYWVISEDGYTYHGPDHPTKVQAEVDLKAFIENMKCQK